MLLLTAGLLQSAHLLRPCFALLVFAVQGLLLGLLLIVAHGGFLLWLRLQLWPGLLLDCSHIVALPLLILGFEVLVGLRPSRFPELDRSRVVAPEEFTFRLNGGADFGVCSVP